MSIFLSWSPHGWLIWWECSQCKEITYEVTVREQNVAWGKRLGGWRPND